MKWNLASNCPGKSHVLDANSNHDFKQGKIYAFRYGFQQIVSLFDQNSAHM